ncbi:hypothetical protein Q4E40_17210 [Pontibacter sp. BT731]|uniref:hypothetical protein n=1 Tax=Pontibacter coccineus TaxID=3063328 RepID=UPI0026E2E346|nr:hypothetical protein [Pontibacter sp. BT731]MDO6391880.1 hypothetical protein [Pontibacter sp. BT731]
MTIKPAYLLVLFSFQFTACTQSGSTISEIDPVYGVVLDELYREKGVKEVHVEREQFYERKLVYPRYLSLYLLLDDEGRVIRKETSHNDRISRRLDTAYDAEGKVISTISYEIKPGTSKDRSGREGIDWVYSERMLHESDGKETSGKYTWSHVKQEWHQEYELRTWEQHDTTYTEQRNLYGTQGQLRDLTRAYLLDGDPNVLRQDHLTFSPKGMSEPRYRYTKIEDGKVIEHGNVDYEYELYAFMEKNPGKQRFMFSKHGYSTVLDELARQTTGRLEPTMTYQYNGKGQLILANEYNTEITYERDADGRATAKRERHTGGAGGTISRCYYNKEGLLTHEVKTSIRGEPSETMFYKYTFR